MAFDRRQPGSNPKTHGNANDVGTRRLPLATRFAADMEDTFDQLWVKIQRRLAQPPEEADRVFDEDAQISHHSIQSMVVTSWSNDEGASSVALGLAARAAANCPGEVCLVDADFHDKGLTGIAGLEQQPGLHELMNQFDRRDELVVRLGDSRLWLLPSGRDAAAEDLAAENKLQAVISLLEERFRYVLFDAPCLKQGVEAYRWGRFVINSVLVVAAGQARRQTIAHAVTSMRLHGMSVLGVILNRRVDAIPSWLYPYL